MVTFLSPLSLLGFSAVGAQIFTSWSSPLVASTGADGWGSNTFTCKQTTNITINFTTIRNDKTMVFV